MKKLIWVLLFLFLAGCDAPLPKWDERTGTHKQQVEQCIHWCEPLKVIAITDLYAECICGVGR